jgi:periplasmic protein TonB
MSLRRALLLSVALHALLLATWLPPRPLPQKANGLPLIARLVERPAEGTPLQAPPAVKKASAPRKIVRAKQAPPPREEEVVTPRLAGERIPTPSFDPSTVAKYRLEIISAARQFRRYPPLARENGWQGRAEVRVSFDSVRQPALIISKSSGYAVLDRQAVETLSKALAPLPPLLLGRSFELDFPVVFSLED